MNLAGIGEGKDGVDTFNTNQVDACICEFCLKAIL